MNADDDIPQLGEPEIRGDLAEAQGLVWAEHEPNPEGNETSHRLLVPEEWVEDAVRGALAEFHDDIVEAVKVELRKRTDELKGE